jgi:hypothetical protein
MHSLVLAARRDYFLKGRTRANRITECTSNDRVFRLPHEVEWCVVATVSSVPAVLLAAAARDSRDISTSIALVSAPAAAVMRHFVEHA